MPSAQVSTVCGSENASGFPGLVTPADFALTAWSSTRIFATVRCSPASRATVVLPPQRLRTRDLPPLGEVGSDVSLAPLLCAGLIGWRSLVIAGTGKQIGLYGFGAAAHILAQVAIWQGRSVFAFTRPGDIAAQNFARSLGAKWAGGSDEMPPEPLDAAIIFATVGDLVPLALKAVRRGGRVVCAGIHMTDIPSFPYSLLWEERQIVSVANLTRQDGIDFLRLVPEIGLVTKTTSYALEQANQALADLRAGRFEGAAVLVP